MPLELAEVEREMRCFLKEQDWFTPKNVNPQEISINNTKMMENSQVYQEEAEKYEEKSKNYQNT
jgi:hypothetical protein